MKDETRENHRTDALSENMDAIITAPAQHKVIFENERLRIIEFKVKPGESVPLHTHRWRSFNYVLKLSDFVSYDARGNLKLDSRTGKTEIKEGSVFELPPFPPPHAVENIGGAELHAISVELKD